MLGMTALAIGGTVLKSSEKPNKPMSTLQTIFQRHKAVCLWVLLSWLSLSATAQAQTSVFSYQGQLRNSGVVVDDSCDFTFDLFDAPAGGTRLASLTLANVSVVRGQFTVALDFGVNVFDGQDRWMAITVQCPGVGGGPVTLSPRQPITPVPYALFAKLSDDAASLGGVAPAGYLRNQPNVVDSSHVVDRTLTINDLANDSVASAQIQDNSVQSNDIADNSIFASDLATNSVGHLEIQSSAVGSDEIAGNAVGFTHIQSGAVRSDEILDNSVGTVDIANESLTASDLAPNSVGSSEIISNSITSSELAPNSVGSSEIATNAVQASEIADNSIDSGEIIDNSLTVNDLGPNSVGSSEVIDNSLTANDLASNSVGSSEIATNAVQASEIADNSIDSGEIIDNSLRGADVSTTSGDVTFRSGDLTLTSGGINASTTSTARILNLIDSAGTKGQVANIERATGLSGGNDLLQLEGSTTHSDTAQFIECERGADVEFRVDGDGDVFADGAFTGPADFAEMIQVTGGAESVEPGDVLMIDPRNPRSVVKSWQPGSGLVVGVYSTRPGFVGSEREWDVATDQAESNQSPVKNELSVQKPADVDASAEGRVRLPLATTPEAESDPERRGLERNILKKADMAELFDEVPVAVMGIVPCKVSAENGPIRPGDLLVTASIPGHAMRDDVPRPGTILGKALEPLRSGKGTIRILVSLQ